MLKSTGGNMGFAPHKSGVYFPTVDILMLCPNKIDDNYQHKHILSKIIT